MVSNSIILGFLNLHHVKLMNRTKSKSIFGYELAGIVFIVIIGSMLHFTFELFGHQSVVGVFSAVNESMWEHLKLGFWPALV